MKQEWDEPGLFGVVVRRDVAANIVVSGNFEPFANVLESAGFRYHRFINPSIDDRGRRSFDPGYFLPRSLCGERSDVVWAKAVDLLEKVGADPIKGRDELSKKAERIANTNRPIHHCAPEGVTPGVKPKIPTAAMLTSEAVANLDYFDIIAVNTSSGKDSIATLVTMQKMAQDAGALHKVVAVHADLGRVVAKGTVALARQQAHTLGLPFVVVRKNGADLLDTIRFDQGEFPTPDRRYCTSDFKTQPIASYFTTRKRERRPGQPLRVLNVLGLRGEESSDRNNQPAVSVTDINPEREVVRYLPIQSLSVDDVWDIVHDSGLPWPDDYNNGNDRHSCRFCIYGSKKDWFNGLEEDPELAADYIATEATIDHTLQPAGSLTELNDVGQFVSFEAIDHAKHRDVPKALRIKTDLGLAPVISRSDKVAGRERRRIEAALKGAPDDETLRAELDRIKEVEATERNHWRKVGFESRQERKDAGLFGITFELIEPPKSRMQIDTPGLLSF